MLFLLSEDELRHVLTDSGAAFVVTTPEFLPKVTAAAAGVGGVRGIIVCGEPPGRRTAAGQLLSFRRAGGQRSGRPGRR